MASNKQLKIAVIGGRDFNNYERLSAVLDQIADKISYIISGGAKGADTLGEKYANDNSIDTLIFKPDWKRYGRGAGSVRNKTIIATCDVVYAFWDGKSKGTKNAIDYANKIGKEVTIIKY